MASLADMARRLKSRSPGVAGKSLPALILMTDRVRLPDPSALIANLPRGAAVIVRHEDAAERDALARRLLPLCRARHVRLLIGGDARLAAEIGAAGLHLPEAMAAGGPAAWSLWRRPDWLVTASAHGPAGLLRAGRIGADAALLAPVFATASHPRARPLGPLRFALWARTSPLPVYALGGVTAPGARRLLASGCVGFAGIGAFVGAAAAAEPPGVK